MPTLLMLVPFGIVLTTGMVFIYLSARHARQGRETGWASAGPGSLERAVSEGCRALLWRQPRRWVAVRSGDIPAVQAALRLRGAAPCSWQESLARVDDTRLFVSPPVQGWILVMGNSMPDPVDDVDASFHFLRRLSLELGEVHFYSCNRALNHHSWVRVAEGCVIRAYCWAGETLWNQGVVTMAEQKLGMTCHAYASSAGMELGRADGPEALNTERVLQLAACWSVDPARIEEAVCGDPWGIAGEIPPRSLG